MKLYNGFIFFFLTAIIGFQLLIVSCDAILPNQFIVNVSPHGGIYIDEISVSMSCQDYNLPLYYSLTVDGIASDPVLFTGNLIIPPSESPIILTVMKKTGDQITDILASETYQILPSFSAMVIDNWTPLVPHGEPVVKATTDHGILLGYYILESGSMDIMIVKLNSHMKIEWQRRFGGSETEWISAIEETSQGGVILAGKSSSFGTLNGNDDDFFIIKLDNAGNIIWQKSYEGSSNQCAYSLAKKADGGFIIAGRTSSFGAQSEDFWILNIYSTGIIENEIRLGTNNNDRANSISIRPDGGFVVAGPSGTDIWVLNFSPLGILEWQKIYGGTGTDSLDSILYTSDGGYIILGESDSFTTNNQIWLLKIDGQGVVKRSRLFTCSGYQESRLRGPQSQKSIVRTSNDGYCIVGYADTATDSDFLIIKLSQNEEPNWWRTYSRFADSLEYAFGIDAYGDGYVVIGQTGGSEFAGTPMLLLCDHEGAIRGSSCIVSTPSLIVTQVPISQINVIDTTSEPFTSSAATVDGSAVLIASSTSIQTF